MTPTQRVAAYMQEHLDAGEQLAMLNIMGDAMNGRLDFQIAESLEPHVMAICGILSRKDYYGHQSNVAA